MFVGNDNGEVISVISRSKGQCEGCVVGIDIGDSVIVKFPSVGQFSTFILVGNVGSENHYTVLADERVTADDNVRVRIDCQSVSISAV